MVYRHALPAQAGRAGARQVAWMEQSEIRGSTAESPDSGLMKQLAIRLGR